MPTAQHSKSATKVAAVQFVEPMYAQLVQQLPEGKDWLYEVKFDGYRCAASSRRWGGLWSPRNRSRMLYKSQLKKQFYAFSKKAKASVQPEPVRFKK